jgi:hypothetical protein
MSKQELEADTLEMTAQARTGSDATKVPTEELETLGAGQDFHFRNLAAQETSFSWGARALNFSSEALDSTK